MDENKTTETVPPVFDPLNIMGIFWSIFGVIVLIATPFIQDTTLTPMISSIIVNILAGSLLVIIGVGCLWKAKSKRDKIRKKKEH
ncbi:hypothetical protein GF337_09605 [candidate division KSB1 bacterium]|nr:hypothetical protein [candidate division KSB1 bacterium]